MSVVIANVIDFIAAIIQVGFGSIKQKRKILVVQTIQLLMQGVSMLLLGGSNWHYQQCTILFS